MLTWNSIRIPVLEPVTSGGEGFHFRKVAVAQAFRPAACPRLLREYAPAPANGSDE